MKQVYGIIYLLINKVNGKKYVGQAISNKRIEIHKRLAKHPKHPIDWAIHDFGWDSFKKDKIKIVYWRIAKVRKSRKLSQEQLDKLEDHYIIKLNTLVPNGYNVRRGGSHGKHHSKTKEKQSLSRKRYLMEHPEAVMGKNNGMFGRREEKHHHFGKHNSKSANKKTSLGRKKYFNEHPEAKLQLSIARKKYFNEHPEVRLRLSDKIKRYRRGL